MVKQSTRPEGYAVRDVSSGCQAAANSGFCSYVVNQILKNKAFGKDRHEKRC